MDLISAAVSRTSMPCAAATYFNLAQDLWRSQPICRRQHAEERSMGEAISRLDTGGWLSRCIFSDSSDFPPPIATGGEAAKNRAVDGRFPLPRARVAYSF